MENKVKELELEKESLSKNWDDLEKEKGNQIKALQDALEDALEDKIKLQTKYEKELQDLQQSNSGLLDDFEWKLHEVEFNCRKKLVEKEQQVSGESEGNLVIIISKIYLTQVKVRVRARELCFLCPCFSYLSCQQFS